MTHTGQDVDPWKALLVLLTAGFMVMLDVSIVNVALPSIESGLGAGEADLQWIVSGYALALGVLLVPGGRFGDAHDRRAVFMSGVALFVLASAGCGLAPDAITLVAARVAQGFAGALVTPQITAFIQELFRGDARGKAFGLFGTTVGISTAFGPLLGGALIALFGPDQGWRAVFFVNLPIGAAILALARDLLPAPDADHQREHQSLDPLGVILLAAALVAVLIPLIEHRTWDSSLRPLLYPAAAILLVAFVIHEHRYARTRQPMVNLGLFKIRAYVLGLSIGLIYFAGFTGTFFIYTQYVQIGLRYTPLEAGLASMPFAVGSALMASVGGRQALRHGRKLVAFGLVTVLVGFGLIYLAVSIEPGADVGLAAAIPLLIAGLGGGLVIAPNQTLTLNDVPVQQAGSAGGVLQTSQRVGAAVGIAVTGSVFYSAVADTDGDFAIGFRQGVIAIGCFVTAALVLAVYDSVTDARR